MDKLAKTGERQVLRGLVLRIAEAADPLGAGVEVIHAAVKRYGHTASRDDIYGCCNYLEGKGLIRMEFIKNEILDIKRDIAHITPLGIDVLEGTTVVEGIVLG